VSNHEFDELEPTLPLRGDPSFVRWTGRLRALSSSGVSIREATPDAYDGRRMKDLQVVCSPISVQSVRNNASTIAECRVLLAEIDDVHIGFCVSALGLQDSDPLFIKVVAVAPDAQRRGAGMALLTAAAEQWPRRDIALATQNENAAARALNERFAKVMGATIRKTRLDHYRDSDLGIQRGWGYRAWVIQRPPVEL
jgi:ribosomal protein S18 acetylase RimI-like enzyme